MIKSLDSCSCIDGRSYGASEGQVHENPEWEKARQALASISNKSQTSAKTTPANRTTAEVCVFEQLMCLSYLIRALPCHTRLDYTGIKFSVI